jgi:hypothetical protein
MKLSIRYLSLFTVLFFNATWICYAQVDSTVGAPTDSGAEDGFKPTENKKDSVTMRVRVGDSELEITGPADFVERKIAEFLKNPPTPATTQLKESTSTPPKTTQLKESTPTPPDSTQLKESTPTPPRKSGLVESPTASNGQGESLQMGGAYKSTKNVIEEEKPAFWSWYANIGYQSQYNFRGTNLTPDAAGAGSINAQVSKGNFTLGVFGIHQFGTASAPSWAIGEGGGGGTPSTLGLPIDADKEVLSYTRFPTTTQTSFDELDVFLSYTFTLGPIDVTLGNIGFFIFREATTFETDVLPEGSTITWQRPRTRSRFRTVGPNPTVENEQFDRVYIRLSTTKISKYITPSITYYQTIYSEGSQPTPDDFPVTVRDRFPDRIPGKTRLIFYPNIPTPIGPPFNPAPFNERNEALGGYLEGRINGRFPLANWIDFNPYGIISVSFRDRTEPGGANPYGGHPLTGWNHVEAGAAFPIHLAHLRGSSGSQWAPEVDFYFVPFGAYSYHISNPPAGTDQNEAWGGARFDVTF